MKGDLLSADRPPFLPQATRAPVPRWVRRALMTGAVLLIVAAAAVNISHTGRNANDLGMDGFTVLVVAVLPDFGLPLSFLRLRYYRRCPWGWAGIAISVALIAWSALASSDPRHGLPGKIMSLVCLTFAIVAAGQAHLPAAETPEVLIAHIEALAEDTERTARAAADRVTAEAARAVSEARDAARASHQRAETLASSLAAEQSARAAEVAGLQAAVTAHVTAHEVVSEPARTAHPTARREPKRRPTRTAKTQVAAEIAEGLTDSEVAVLSYMLGRGPVQRQTVVEDTGIPLGTVKRAVAQLAVKGHVVACAARGQYRSVSPDLATDEPMAASE